MRHNVYNYDSYKKMLKLRKKKLEYCKQKLEYKQMKIKYLYDKTKCIDFLLVSKTARQQLHRQHCENISLQ